MSDPGFLQVMVIAFGAQLAVLPGEKVQFIIAGLSTRFDPKVVVAAAGSAFALWTAIEILVGEALQQALPGDALDAITAGMFLLFAYLLWRSIPDADGPDPDERVPEVEGTGAADAGSTETDGGEAAAETDGGIVAEDGTLDVEIPVIDRQVPTVLGSFLPIFVMMFVGEFGDKTQIVTIGLAATYGATPAIWAGEMLAIIPVSLANAYFFNRFAGRVDFRRVHVGSALLFLFFGLDTLAGLLLGVSAWEELVDAMSGITAFLALAVA